LKDEKEGEGQLYAKGIWVSRLTNQRKKFENSDSKKLLMSEKYSGNFSKDVFNGYGVYIDEVGNLYEGEFKNGKKCEE
jgi:hypothetical protein